MCEGEESRREEMKELVVQCWRDLTGVWEGGREEGKEDLWISE